MSSSFDYNGVGPDLELTTTHTVKVPDPLYGGGTEPTGPYRYRIFGAESGDPVGLFIDIERTGSITMGGAVPILNFDFLHQQVTNAAVVPSGLMFSRGAFNAARYAWGITGVLSSALGANVPCYEWDGSSSPEGILIEPAMTNLCVRSTSIRSDLGHWGDGFTGVTNTGPNQDPHGGTQGATLQNTRVTQNVSGASGVYVVSLLIKDPSGSNSTNGSGLCMWDVATAVFSELECFITAFDGSSGWSAYSTPRVIKKGLNNWWQIELLWNTALTPSVFALDNRTAQHGCRNAPVYIHSAGFFLGTRAPNPIDTGTSTASNDPDIMTLDASSISAWKACGRDWTIEFEVDAADTGPLMYLDGVPAFNLPTTGTVNLAPYSNPFPRKYVWANKTSASKVFDSLAPSSPISGASLDISGVTTFKLASDKPIHYRRVKIYNKGLS